MKMATNVNTRKHKRYLIKLKIRINTGRLNFWAVTSDISKKGLRMRTNQEFPVNKKLDLELIMPDGQVSFISGVVRYVKETPHSEIKFGVGLEIIYDDTTFSDYLKSLEEEAVIKREEIEIPVNNFSQNKEDVAEHKAYMLSPVIVANPLEFVAITEHVQDSTKDVQTDIAPQESDIIQSSDEISNDFQKQIRVDKKEEELIGVASIASKIAMPSESKCDKGRDKKKNFSHVFIVILLAIGIAAIGIFLYRNSNQDLKIQQASSLMCSIQIGAFQSQANAQIFSKIYQEKGYDVSIEKSDIKDKGIMYKVLIGPFKNFEDTSRLAMDLREKENINPFVVCK
jgi:hypothetical protein